MLKSIGWHSRKKLKRLVSETGNTLSSPLVRTDVCGVDHYYGTPTGVARHTDLIWQLIEQVEGIRTKRVMTKQGLPHGVGKPRTTIWIAQARDLPKAIRQLSWLHKNSRRNVGYWSYELDPMPENEAVNARFLSEIWVVSEFVATCIRRSVSAVPCYVIPPPALLDGTAPMEARDYSSLNKFLVVLDAYSSVERKNPWTAIRAFKNVFGSDPTKTLTVRVVRAEGLSEALRKRLQLEETAQVKVVLETFRDVAAAHEYMRQHDVYVSLHRTEGLGFNIIESILMGIPLVVTGYGGNVDFCDPDGADVIGYDLVTGVCSQGIYKGDFVWAEPRLEEACAALRRLAERSPEEVENRVRLAREVVLRHFDTERIQKILVTRLRHMRGSQE